MDAAGASLSGCDEIFNALIFIRVLARRRRLGCGGLAVCGALLVLKGLAARRTDGERSEWILFAGWTRSRHHAFAFALMIGVNVFYIFAVDALGFIPTGVIYLGALFWVFGVRTRWIVPMAIVITLVIHYSFYKLLKVPLPWGVLQGISW